jgi:hypothetical protein
MTPGFRAIVVLDEMFSRAADSIHEQIWSLFAEGVDRVTRMLSACQPEVDAVALAWRIRFVTAAALDIPPRDDDRSPQGKDALPMAMTGMASGWNGSAASPAMR